MINDLNSFRSEKHLFSILWAYVVKDKINLLITSIFLIVNTGFTIAAPFFFQKALIIIERVENGNKSQALAILIIPLLFYLTLTVLTWFSQAAITIFTTRLNAGLIRNIRKDTFASLLKNNVSFYDNSESGNLVSIITNDLNELYETGNAIAEVITASLRLLGILGLLFFYSVILTITSLILLPFFFITTMMIRKYRRNAEREWRSNFGKVNQSFAETMRSIEISKAFNRENENIAMFTNLNEATYQASIKRGAAIFVSRPLADFLRNIMLIVLLAVGSILVQNAGLSIATFYLFIFLIDLYYEPIRAIARNYYSFQSLFANLERILSIALTSSRYEDFSMGRNLNEFSGHIEFKNVNFSYDTGKIVLHDISFSVQAGQRVAIVGHTGAGKSTIASLLIRYYSLSSGQILLDQIPMEDYDLISLRKHVALVSQRVLLFKGTIKDNLEISKPNASEEEMWAAIDAVQAREFIELLPKGLDSLIEEGGKNLSAGQRQMISFARALLTNPRLIILDEATSAVDLYTEAKIQQSTDLLLKNRTSIVIAHRLTTILRSDLIIVLEEGKISQIGIHENLISQDGPYKTMYDLYFKTQSAEYLEKIKARVEN